MTALSNHPFPVGTRVVHKHLPPELGSQFAVEVLDVGTCDAAPLCSGYTITFDDPETGERDEGCTDDFNKETS